MGKSRSHEHDEERHPSPGHGAHGGPHGGSHEEHEGAPEWLISFADNVMLMMGVFVILLALNMGKSSTAYSSTGDHSDEQSAPAMGSGGYTDEELDFAIAVRAAFNNAVDIHSTDPNDARLVRRLRERLRGHDQEAEDSPQDRSPLVVPRESSRLGGIITFSENSSQIGVEGERTIEELATDFRGLRYAVELRGHASLLETMHNPEQGFRIGYDRAVAVARALTERGLAWERMRITSCGDAESGRTSGKFSRETAAGGRVEVFLSARVIDEAPPASARPGPPPEAGKLPQGDG